MTGQGVAVMIATTACKTEGAPGRWLRLQSQRQ